MFKILVVEDDKELNHTVCSFLNQRGYEAIPWKKETKTSTTPKCGGKSWRRKSYGCRMR